MSQCLRLSMSMAVQNVQTVCSALKTRHQNIGAVEPQLPTDLSITLSLFVWLID